MPRPCVRWSPSCAANSTRWPAAAARFRVPGIIHAARCRSEEHTSELQSQSNLVCRLLLEKKNQNMSTHSNGANVKIAGTLPRIAFLFIERPLNELERVRTQLRCCSSDRC